MDDLEVGLTFKPNQNSTSKPDQIEDPVDELGRSFTLLVRYQLGDSHFVVWVPL
jgi:hypothetical protein